MLGKLFSDPDAEVRRAAAMCFRQFEGDDAGEFQDLIETYIHSPALTPAHDLLLHALGRTTANIPDIILATGERFFDIAGRDAGDLRTGSAMGSTYLANWASRQDLAGLMEVSVRRVSQLAARLEEFDLVSHSDGPRARRLALTDRGLALLARRDRTSVGTARRRWSVAPINPLAPLTWRNVSGSRSRQLLRNVEHTGAVHWFLASLAVQARAAGWQVAQFNSPRRASRYFQHDGRLRSVRPDAFGVLRRGDATVPFFLEWERRAVRPVAMAARIAPYLRYYATRRPLDDHGAVPLVLVVFDDELASTQFTRVARREMEGAGVQIPLWVSHKAALESLGTLGRAWQTAKVREPTYAFPVRAVQCQSGARPPSTGTHLQGSNKRAKSGS